MCEVFKAYILTASHKPIIFMFEDIGESIMTRLQRKRDEIGGLDVKICPRIWAKLDKKKAKLVGWWALQMAWMPEKWKLGQSDDL